MPFSSTCRSHKRKSGETSSPQHLMTTMLRTRPQHSIATSPLYCGLCVESYLVYFICLCIIVVITFCYTVPTNHDLSSWHWRIRNRITTFFPRHKLHLFDQENKLQMVKEQNVFQEKCKCSVYSLGNGWGKYSVGKVCTCHWKKIKL